MQRRSVRMKWHRKTVMRGRRIKFDGGLFGDAPTPVVMLKHAGKEVLIGIDPNDYHAPAMVRGRAEERLRGRVLLEQLPLYEATRHGDGARRRKAVAEDRRVKKLVAKHTVVDVDRKVAELRRAVMAVEGLAPQAAKPAVVALDTRVPFSSVPPASALTPKMLRNLDLAIGFTPVAQTGKSVRWAVQRLSDHSTRAMPALMNGG